MPPSSYCLFGLAAASVLALASACAFLAERGVSPRRALVRRWRALTGFRLGMIAAVLISCCLETSAGNENHFGVAEDDVVATPIAYEASERDSPGSSAKATTGHLGGASSTKHPAVLFQIQSPAPFHGRLFRLRHSGCTCYMCRLSSPVTNLYAIGSYYNFRQDHAVSNMLCATTMQSVPELPMERVPGEYLVLSVQEADRRLTGLAEKEVQTQRQLAECQEKLQSLSSTDSRRERNRLTLEVMRIRHELTNDIPSIRRLLTERRAWILRKGE